MRYSLYKLMIKLKREYFRNSIQKQAREEIFKKKRIVTNNNSHYESNPINESKEFIFELRLKQGLLQLFLKYESSNNEDTRTH